MPARARPADFGSIPRPSLPPLCMLSMPFLVNYLHFSSSFRNLINCSRRGGAWCLLPRKRPVIRYPLIMICVTSGLDEISPVHTGYPWRALPHTHNFSFMRHKITTRCVFICALPSFGLICFHIQYSYYSLFSTALLQESK